MNLPATKIFVYKAGYCFLSRYVGIFFIQIFCIENADDQKKKKQRKSHSLNTNIDVVLFLVPNIFIFASAIFFSHVSSHEYFFFGLYCFGLLVLQHKNRDLIFYMSVVRTSPMDLYAGLIVC